jgi:hypothetical protein
MWCGGENTKIYNNNEKCRGKLIIFSKIFGAKFTSFMN